MDEIVKIAMRDINPLIVCSLCAGYYVDATTISECLHTFCRSCIVKHLQSSNCCPHCLQKIHETQPLINLKPDHVMQDIVYKLVPNLYENEEKRRVEFYRSRGIVREQKEDVGSRLTPLITVYTDPQAHYYKHDPLICFSLSRYCLQVTGCGYTLPVLLKKFIRCSVRVCVYHVKQLLMERLEIPAHLSLEIICCDQAMPDNMCLKQIYLMLWVSKPSPMCLYYRLSAQHVAASSSYSSIRSSTLASPNSNISPQSLAL